MALDIKQHAAVERPIIASGRQASGEFAALIEEVQPLITEVLQLPADKALPVTLPTEQVSDLVRALRAAGDAANVTIRFKRFPRLDENGNQAMTVPKNDDDSEPKPLSDPFEYINKSQSTVRVIFWISKKVVRKPKPAQETINPAD